MNMLAPINISIVGFTGGGNGGGLTRSCEFGTKEIPTSREVEEQLRQKELQV